MKIKAYGPKPALNQPERVARLEQLVDHIHRELDLIIPGDWQVVLEFPGQEKKAVRGLVGSHPDGST